jgi:peptidyl-prolyl cis-trans isomerase SurA
MTLKPIIQKFFVASGLTSLCLVLLSSLVFAETITDRIVAKVNRNIITLSELEARLKILSPQQKAALSAGGNIQRMLLDMMVEEELMNQAAAKMGIAVTDPEIDEAINGIMVENKINQTQLRQSLQASGSTLEAFRHQLRFEILRNKILGYNFMSKIVITDQEVNDFLSGNLPQGTSELVSATGVSDFHPIRMIVLNSSPSTVQKVLTQAEKIKADIENGTITFADAAKQYSVGAGAENGGDPGNVVVRDLQPELQQIAKNLSPGEISAPLNGGNVVLLLTILPTLAQEPVSIEKPKRGQKEKKVYSPEQMAMGRRQLEQIKLRSKFETWLADVRSTAIVKITL